MTDQLMSLPQALALAAVLIDFEIEQPQVTPPPENWQAELMAARQTLTAHLWEIHPLQDREGSPQSPPRHVQSLETS